MRSAPYCRIRCGMYIICSVSVINGRFLRSELGGLAGEILLDHKRYLEGYRMIELAKIEPRELSDLLKSVYEGISVNEELS